MLSAESRTKLQRPGLRLPGWSSLPIGSKIATVVLGLMALIAVFAPLVAPFEPGAAGLVPPDMVVQQEIEIEGVGKQLVPEIGRAHV